MVPPCRRLRAPGSSGERDETLAQANERLEAEAQALAAANQALAQELAEQRRAAEALAGRVDSLRSLVDLVRLVLGNKTPITRFTGFTAERGMRPTATSRHGGP